MLDFDFQIHVFGMSRYVYLGYIRLKLDVIYFRYIVSDYWICIYLNTMTLSLTSLLSGSCVSHLARFSPSLTHLSLFMSLYFKIYLKFGTQRHVSSIICMYLRYMTLSLFFLLSHSSFPYVECLQQQKYMYLYVSDLKSGVKLLISEIIYSYFKLQGELVNN